MEALKLLFILQYLAQTLGEKLDGGDLLLGFSCVFKNIKSSQLIFMLFYSLLKSWDEFFDLFFKPICEIVGQFLYLFQSSLETNHLAIGVPNSTSHRFSHLDGIQLCHRQHIGVIDDFGSDSF